MRVCYSLLLLFEDNCFLFSSSLNEKDERIHTCEIIIIIELKREMEKSG